MIYKNIYQINKSKIIEYNKYYKIMMLNKPHELRLVDFKIFQTIGVGS